jgi:hypothetical protein
MHRGTHFSEVLFLMTSCSKCTRPLTFENLWQYNVAHLIYVARNAKAIITSVSITPGPMGVWQFSEKDGGWILEGEATHAYVHAYVHTYMNTHMHTYIRVHTYLYTYIHTYIHVCIHTYIRVHTYLYTYIHTYMHVCIHTYIHTYTRNMCIYMNDFYTRIHTHMYMYVCIYVYMYV